MGVPLMGVPLRRASHRVCIFIRIPLMDVPLMGVLTNHRCPPKPPRNVPQTVRRRFSPERRPSRPASTPACLPRRPLPSLGEMPPRLLRLPLWSLPVLPQPPQAPPRVPPRVPLQGPTSYVRWPGPALRRGGARPRRLWRVPRRASHNIRVRGCNIRNVRASGFIPRVEGWNHRDFHGEPDRPRLTTVPGGRITCA